MNSYFKNVEGREYMSKLKFTYTDQKIITLTIPKDYLEAGASSSSLQQFKDSRPEHRHYLSFIQFVIEALNDQSLGTNSHDTRFTVNSMSAQNNVLFDGVTPSISHPKYSIVVEYLTIDRKGMEKYSTAPTDGCGLNEIFSNDNFAGFRYWFIIFDPRLDPMEAFDRMIEKNKSYIMIQHIRNKYNKSLKDAINLVYKSVDKPRRRNNQQQAENEEPVNADDISRRVRKTKVMVDGCEITMRQVTSEFVIEDKSRYYRSICDYKKLARPISMLLNRKEIYDNNALDDVNYDLKKDDFNLNPLHYDNWFNISHANERFFAVDYGSTFVNYDEEQANLNRYIQSNGDSFTLQFPFPMLTWTYSSHKFSIKNAMNEVFPWKTHSSFNALYLENKAMYQKDNIEEQKKREEDQFEIVKKNRMINKETKISSKGQTEEEFKQQVNLILVKRKISKMKDDNDDRFNASPEIKEFINDGKYLKNKYDRDIEDMKKQRKDNKIDGSSTTFIRLADYNKEDYAKLMEIKDLFDASKNPKYKEENNSRFRKMLKLYQEEKLADFIREVNPLTKDMTNSIKSMLHWIKTDPTLRNYDQNGDYTISLCQPYFTIDLDIGRSSSMFAYELLSYDALLSFGACHETFYRILHSAFYCFSLADKSQEHLGTRLKPMMTNSGGAGSGKSFMTDEMKKILINGTILSLDGFSDKSLVTGDSSNINDVIGVIDEMGSLFTTNTDKMSPQDQDKHRLIKSVLSNGAITRAVCAFDENDERYTKVIESIINMSLIGHKNKENLGSDDSMENRSMNFVSKNIKRRDKTVSEVLSTIYSSSTKRASDLLVGAKIRSTQFLMMCIFKLLGTHVMPNRVNLDIGKILFSSMITGMKGFFPHLENVIRSPLKNFIMMYILACRDAIDLNFFSEISPFMYRDPGSKETICQEFSYEQVIKIAPSLCLSEDTAIRELTFYIKHEIYNEFLYNSLVVFCQKVCHFKFPRPQESSQLNKKVDEIMKEKKLPEDKREKCKQVIKESYFFDDQDIEDPIKAYTTNNFYSEEDILEIKYWQRKKNVKVVENGMERTKNIVLLDTNFLQLPCTPHMFALSKKMFTTIRGKIACNLDTVRAAIHKEEKFQMHFRPKPVYGVKAEERDGIITKSLYKDEDGSLKDFTKSLYPKYMYTESIFKYLKNDEDSTKSTCLINVNYLTNCSLHSLLRIGLRAVQHNFTRPRTIIVSKNVVGTPHLFQRYDLKNVNRTLKSANPEYLDEMLQNLIYQNRSSDIKVDNKRSENSATHEYDLEAKIFKEHALECGVDPKEQDLINMYLPENVDKSIRLQHSIDVKLKELQKTCYPIDNVSILPPVKNDFDILNFDESEECELVENGSDNPVTTTKTTSPNDIFSAKQTKEHGSSKKAKNNNTPPLSIPAKKPKKKKKPFNNMGNLDSILKMSRSK